MKGTLEERFWAKVHKTKTCWEWTAFRMPFGYGQFAPRGKMKYAHRVSWELEYGPIPEGMCVLHKCDVPYCIRPDHLFLGTHQDNMDDMVSKGRTGGYDKKGEANPKGKLTENMVRIARAVYGTEIDGKKVSYQRIADAFGVQKSCIAHIIQGRKWTHLA